VAGSVKVANTSPARTFEDSSAVSSTLPYRLVTATRCPSVIPSRSASSGDSSSVSCGRSSPLAVRIVMVPALNW
jgi:hypothetical protein